MDWIRAIEIFAVVSGIIYILLEIGQKNVMWMLGILTSAACAFSFFSQSLWASMGLNLYYVAVSVLGLVRWRRDGARLEEGTIHLTKLPKRTAIVSAALFVAGSLGAAAILRSTGDGAPLLDAIVTVLGIIGTWWLTRSYPEQWMIWIVANLLSVLLCVRTGLFWMAALYLGYAVSAVYGYFHWMNKGQYIEP